MIARGPRARLQPLPLCSEPCWEQVSFALRRALPRWARAPAPWPTSFLALLALACVEVRQALSQSPAGCVTNFHHTALQAPPAVANKRAAVLKRSASRLARRLFDSDNTREGLASAKFTGDASDYKFSWCMLDRSTWERRCRLIRQQLERAGRSPGTNQRGAGGHRVSRPSLRGASGLSGAIGKSRRRLSDSFRTSGACSRILANVHHAAAIATLARLLQGGPILVAVSALRTPSPCTCTCSSARQKNTSASPPRKCTLCSITAFACVISNLLA